MPAPSSATLTFKVIILFVDDYYYLVISNNRWVSDHSIALSTIMTFEMKIVSCFVVFNLSTRSLSLLDMRLISSAIIIIIINVSYSQFSLKSLEQFAQISWLYHQTNCVYYTVCISASGLYKRRSRNKKSCLIIEHCANWCWPNTQTNKRRKQLTKRYYWRR